MSVVVVPMHVSALVVGQPDSQRKDAFARMGYDFESLADIAAGAERPYLGVSITPEATALLQPGDMAPGIHLHWAVPAAVAHTHVSEGSSQVQFDPAPNRWLVVRIAATADDETDLTAAWIVESDRLWDDNPPADTEPGSRSRPVPIVPTDDDLPKVTRRLGRVTPLARFIGDHSTDAADHTVAGYGITTFAAAYQHAPNVFGIWDGLDSGATGLSALSYLVAGWHSAPGDDPVHGLEVPPGGTVASALADATGWQFAPVDGADPPARSIYAGAVTGVAHDLTRSYSGSGPAADDLAIAVGATAPEALAALIAAADGDPGLEQTLTLLQEGLLPQLTTPGGTALCDDRLHASRFVAVPGGTRWTLARKTTTKAGDDGGVDLAAAARSAGTPLPSALTTLLGQLNACQSEADALARSVESARSQLFADWCKYLDMSVKDDPALTGALNFLQATVVDLTAAIDDLTTKQIAAKAKHDELDGKASADGYTLSPTPAPRFWRPADPVVLLMGKDVVRPDRQGRNGAKGFPFPVTTRLEQSLIGSLPVAGGAELTEDDVPGLDLTRTAFGSQLAGLICETVLLDAGQAPALAKRLAARLGRQVGSLADDIAAAQAEARAKVPALGYATWKQQPWIPLMLDWELTFTPDKGANATLGDYEKDLLTGGYKLHPDRGELVSDAPPPAEQVGLVYSGSALLTSGVTLPLRGQIDKFVQSYPHDPVNAELIELEHKLKPATPEYPDGTPLLAQALSGFGDALLMRRQTLQLPVYDPSAEGMMQDFGDSVAKLVTPSPDAAHSPDTAHNDLAPLPNRPFAPLRAGTARFTANVRLVDAFGQHRTIPASSYVRAASLIPPPAPPAAPDARALWLPPRLQQGARLMFRWLSARDDRIESVDVASSPVCGWLLFNHIDDSIAVYDADGTPLGSLGVDDSVWRNAPTDPVALADKIGERLAHANPHLSAFATNLVLPQPRPAFVRDLLDTIDATLTNVATATAIGSGSTAALVGRPLALVRASIDLELLGAPALNQSRKAFDAACGGLKPGSSTGGIVRDDGGVPSVDVSVELGDPDAPHDGLIGFFVGDSYDKLFAPLAVDHGNGVLQPGAKDLRVSAGGASVMLTLLVDPAQAVHATTGILPRKSITLPPSMYAHALRTLEVTITVTPALLDAGAATVPVPPEPGFDWSWLTLADDGHGGATLDTAALRVAATGLGGPPAQVADGWLALQPSKPVSDSDEQTGES